MPKKKSIIIAVIIVVIIALVGVVIFTARGAGTAVEAVEAKTDALSVTVLASGVVTAGESRDVYPETQGLLKSIDVKEGESVHAGQILATIDDDASHAQLAQAKSGLAQAKSGLAQAQAAGSSANSGIAAAKASLAAAQSGLSAANSAYKSAKKLSTLAKTTLSNAKTAVEMYEKSGAAAANPTGYMQAKSAVTQAQVSYEQSKSGVSQAKAGVAQAKAGVAQAKSAVKQAESAKPSAAIDAANSGVSAATEGVSVAKKAVDATVITAPIDGTVLFAPTPTAAAAAATGSKPTTGAEPMKGSAVAPGSAVFTIVDSKKLSFTVEVDEVDIPKIKLGQPAQISLDSFNDRDYTATVSTIGTTAKSTLTGGTVFAVELAFDTVDPDVKLGMKGDSTIEIETKNGALTVPIEGLFSEGGKDFVYVIDSENHLKRTIVTVGTTTDTSVEIVDGLAAKTKVALAGSEQFVDNLKVAVKTTAKQR